LRSRTTRLAPLIVFVLAACVYASFLPRLYTADDLQYAGTIRVAVTGRPFYHPVGGPHFPATRQKSDIPVNPRYALDWPTSVAAVRVARSLGWHDEVDAILITRAVLGAVGVTFFFMTVLLLARRFSIAAVTAAALAASSVYWTYSTHLDESIGMMAFTAGALFFFVRRVVDGRSRVDLIVPLLLGVASLYNLTAVVTAVPMALVWALGEGTTSARRWLRSLALFGCTYVGAAALGIIGALLATGAGDGIFKAGFWRSSLFVGRPEYGLRPFHYAFAAGASFLRALVSYPPVRGLTTLREYFTVSSTGPRAAALLYYAVVGLLAVLPLVFLLHARPLDDRMRRLTVFGFVWLSASLIFGWWWDPEYVKYFLLPVLSWCFLLALALARLVGVRSRFARPALAVSAAAVAALLALNLWTIFLPQRRKGANEWLAAAAELRRSEPNALFVSAGRHPLDFYIAYFANRDVISAGLVRYAAGNGRTVERVVSRRIREHTRVGGPIYVYGLGTVSPAERSALFGLLPGKGLRAAWRFPHLTVYRRDSG
jgi:hypothetical protein